MAKAVALIVMVASFAAHAYDRDRAGNNLAHEMAACAAYFTTVAHMPSMVKPPPEFKDKAEAAKKNYEAASKALLEASATLTSREVTLARYALELQDIQRKMKKRWENLSIITLEYRDVCEEVHGDPEARLRYWLEKKE